MLYFAYGCNMDPDHLAAVVGTTLEPGWPARADGWRLAFNHAEADGTVVASLVEAEGCCTYGVVYRLPQAALPALDEFEQVRERYRRASLWVEPVGRRARQAALTYLGRSRWTVEEGRPQPDYLALLLRGAALHALPGAYVDWVRSLARGEAEPCYSD